MEALPFLTEAYAQRPYAATSTGVAPNITISWSSAGTAGYAIEIRNPFNRTISLQNVNLWVANANWGPLNTLAGQATLPPNAILILYRNSTGGSNDDISLLIAPGAITKAITNDWPTAAAPVTLELRATNQTGAPLTWAYSKIINAVSMPDSVSLTNQSAPITGADYRQATTIGNGQKINIMLTPPSGFIPFTEQTAAYAADIDRLGDTPKPGQPTGKIADANLNKNQLLFRDDAHGLITSVGELAHIAFVPLDGTKTFAEAWGTASDAAQHMLNFAGPVVTGQAIPTSPAGPQYEAVPHAMLVLDRFTTLSPYEDGVDNDNDQTVTGDIDENFVPGTININTATTDVIRYAIPLPASLRASGANDVAAALVGYRDNAAKRPTAITGLRTAKGIASLGEIYNIFNPQNAPTVANPLASDTTDNRSIDGMLIDDIANASNTSGDAIVDDREEAAAILRMLSQVCSVRSDIFTAYIVIRGFPNDLKPSDLAILNPTVTADAKKLSDYYARVTERRLIVVFDRSRVTDIASPIHILGFYQY
jgi:hypothetical protein